MTSLKTIILLGLGTLGCQSLALLKNHPIQLNIILIDRDVVEAENLPRQPLYTKKNIGTPKAYAAAKHLEHTSHKTTILATEINTQTLNLLKGDIIIDGTDNLATRQIVSEYAKANNIPFIYGAAVGCEGAVCAFTTSTATFDQVFGTKKDSIDCATAGIELETAKKVAQKQYEITKDILDNKETAKKMYLYIKNEVHEFGLPKIAKIQKKLFTDDILDKKITKLCGRHIYQSWIPKTKAKALVKNKPFLKTEKYTVFPDGRILIRTTNKKDVELIKNNI